MKTPETARPSAVTPTEVIDALADLHTRTVDALAGYEKVVEKAEPEFRPVAQQFRDLHSRHAAQLASLLTSLGASVDADGSFMATINRTVVSLRAFFDEIDEDVMDNIRSGEDHVLRAFESVLASGPTQPYHADLMAMREDLLRLLDATRHLD